MRSEGEGRRIRPVLPCPGLSWSVPCCPVLGAKGSGTAGTGLKRRVTWRGGCGLRTYAVERRVAKGGVGLRECRGVYGWMDGWMDGVGCEAVRCGAVSWEGGSLGWKRVSVDSWGKGERGEGRGERGLEKVGGRWTG